MNNLTIALIIGIVAGTIDVVPMLIQKLDKASCISAFFHYLALGLIIPFVHWGIQAWITGLLISILSAIPIIIIVYPKDKKAILPIAAFSVLLGIGIALAGAKFIVRIP